MAIRHQCYERRSYSLHSALQLDSTSRVDNIRRHSSAVDRWTLGQAESCLKRNPASLKTHHAAEVETDGVTETPPSPPRNGSNSPAPRLCPASPSEVSRDDVRPRTRLAANSAQGVAGGVLQLERKSRAGLREPHRTVPSSLSPHYLLTSLLGILSTRGVLQT